MACCCALTENWAARTTSLSFTAAPCGAPGWPAAGRTATASSTTHKPIINASIDLITNSSLNKKEPLWAPKWPCVILAAVLGRRGSCRAGFPGTPYGSAGACPPEIMQGPLAYVAGARSRQELVICMADSIISNVIGGAGWKPVPFVQVVHSLGVCLTRFLPHVGKKESYIMSRQRLVVLLAVTVFVAGVARGDDAGRCGNTSAIRRSRTRMASSPRGISGQNGQWTSASGSPPRRSSAIPGPTRTRPSWRRRISCSTGTGASSPTEPSRQPRAERLGQRRRRPAVGEPAARADQLLPLHGRRRPPSG